MADDQGDDSDDGPEPSGPFYSNYGPRDGDVLYGTAPVMGVLADPSGTGGPIGIVWLAGAIDGRHGPVQLWELEVAKVRLEGRWICRNRQFIRIGDAAEEV